MAKMKICVKSKDNLMWFWYLGLKNYLGEKRLFSWFKTKDYGDVEEIGQQKRYNIIFTEHPKYLKDEPDTVFKILLVADVPKYIPAEAKKVDLLISPSKLVSSYNKNFLYLPYACSNEYFYPEKTIIRKNFACFVGSMWEFRRKFFKKFPEIDVYKNKGFDETRQIYAKYKIVVDYGQYCDEAQIDSQLTMRVFEAAACGNRVLTDKQPYVYGHNLPGIEKYNSEEHLKQLLNKYKKLDPQAGTMPEHYATHHSYKARARTLLRALVRLGFEV